MMRSESDPSPSVERLARDLVDYSRTRKSFSLTSGLIATLQAIHGFNEDEALEYLTDSRVRKIERALKSALSVYRSQGVAAPLEFADGKWCSATCHPGFESLTGLAPITQLFWELQSVIENANPDLLRGAAAYWLTAIGCEAVYITDGSNDQGVDVVGVLAQSIGPCIFVCVQCKSGEQKASVSDVESEKSKFDRILVEDGVTADLLKNLRPEYLESGSARLFGYLASSGFKRDVARRLTGSDVLLLTSARVAHDISQSHRGTDLADLDSLGPFSRPRPPATKNWAVAFRDRFA